MESFESPKVALLVFTAILLLVGFATQWISTRNLQNRNFSVTVPTDVKGKKGKHRREKKQAQNSIKAILHWDFSNPITRGILLFFVSAIFSTLFSVSPRTSFYGEDDSYAGLITITSYTILFLGTKTLCRKIEHCRTLLVATLIGVGFSVVYGIIQSAGLDPFSWKRTSVIGDITRIFGTMGHPNQLAAFLVMGFPIVCYFRLDLFKKRAFALGILLIVVEIFAAAIIVLSLSRGAWLGMGAMLLVFLYGIAKVTQKKQAVLLALLPWVIGIALGAFYFSILSSDHQASVPSTTTAASSSAYAAPTIKENRLLARIQQMGPSTITQGTRWPIWTAAFDMFVHHPLLGVGLDAFHLAFMKYRPAEYWMREWGGTPTRAHNELLHILATQGGLGLMAALAILWGLAKTFAKTFICLSKNDLATDGLSKSAIAEHDGLMMIAIFAGIVGFYTQNMFNFTVIGTGTLFMTLAAIIARFGEEVNTREIVQGSARPLNVFSKSVLFALAGVAVYLLVFQPMRASYLVAKTVFNRSLPAASASENLEEALLIDATKDDYFHHLGTSYRKSARETKDPNIRARALILAKDAYQHAIDLVPVDSNNHVRLATLLVVMAKEKPPLATSEEIYNSIKMAIKLDPNNADVYAIGADIAISFGDSARALIWAKKCADIYPHYAPARAQQGFIALLDAVRFLKNDAPKEGIVYLDEAITQMEKSLPMFWPENYEAKKKSTQNDLAKAYLFKAKAQKRLIEIANSSE